MNSKFPFISHAFPYSLLKIILLRQTPPPLFFTVKPNSLTTIAAAYYHYPALHSLLIIVVYLLCLLRSHLKCALHPDFDYCLGKTLKPSPDKLPAIVLGFDAPRRKHVPSWFSYKISPI